MRSRSILNRAAAALIISGFGVGLLGDLSGSQARPARRSSSVEQTRAAGTPLLAVVALNEQHITIYDAEGKILQAPVSSGATGYETPAGIYSIVQKEEEHHSNLYDDASMPFMERITWTGMALHAGVLPGYAASHGCVRMRHAFAEQLYQLTKMGMRVIVVREDIAPGPIAQPSIFRTSPKTSNLAPQGGAVKVSNSPSDMASPISGPRQEFELQTIASDKSLEAEAAIRRERELRAAAAKKSAEAAPSVRTLRTAESNFAKAESDLKEAERVIETNQQGATPQADAAKSQALSKLEVARSQLKAAQLEAQGKGEAAARAGDEAKAALLAANLAKDAAERAKQNLSPISVFISRKTQRLYIRKGNFPVFESAVSIRDADKPLGSFVFTALDYSGSPGEMRWNVVSMYRDALNVEPYVAPQKGKAKVNSSEPAPADAASAQAALDRLVVPQEAVERMSEVVLPGSSLIISDEGPSIETGKDTDFVIFMSGEPQGGIAIRQHNTAGRRGRDEDADSWFFSRSNRGRSREGFGFFFD